MITRVLAVGALSLPLALGAASIASADTGDTNRPTIQLTAQSQGESTDEDRGDELDLNLDGLFDNDGQDNQDEDILNIAL